MGTSSLVPLKLNTPIATALKVVEMLGELRAAARREEGSYAMAVE